MHIQTTRCVIRPFLENDLDAFTACRNDMDWMQYQGFKGRTRQEYADAVLGERALRHGAQFAIACRHTNALIGDIYLRQEETSYWIGYTIHRTHARQGYAYEAVSAVIAALRAQGAACLHADTDTGNTASIALMKKLGFRDAGIRYEERSFTLSLQAPPAL